MEKISILFIMLLIAIRLDAQEYTVSFAASGASSKVDSVFVQNLNTATSIAVGGQETLHVTATNTGAVSDIYLDQNNIRVFPNPFNGQTTFEFHNSIGGSVAVELVDLNGRNVFSTEAKTSPGTQLYTFKGVGHGIYVLKVKAGKNVSIAKLISTDSSVSDITLQYQGSRTPENMQSGTKSGLLNNSIKSDEGNLLLLTGVSGIYRTVVPLVVNKDTVVTFDFVPCTDADGNNYTVVKIGEQLWMAENLKTTKYGNGESVSSIEDNSAWSNLTTGAYCAYNNKDENSSTYGYLYNWYAASDSNNLAPIGWHVPSDAEWQDLNNYLGGDFVAGGKQKSIGTAYWDFPNTNATNETGFSGLPSGTRSYSGAYALMGKVGYFWSSSNADSFGAWLHPLVYDDEGAQRGYNGKKFGYSIRCLKDFNISNFIEINGIRYDLANGFLAYYGNFEGHGVYNHQITLYGPEIEINWDDYTVKGIGPAIDFEIFNTKSYVENGSYSFSLPEIAETVKVYENFDVNNDGVINDLDYYTTLPDGKYYISSRLSYYGKEIDFNDYYSEPPAFESGNATIVISGDKYSITFDCKGKNGDVIRGYFEGNLKYLDWSEN